MHLMENTSLSVMFDIVGLLLPFRKLYDVRQHAMFVKLTYRGKDLGLGKMRKRESATGKVLNAFFYKSLN